MGSAFLSLRAPQLLLRAAFIAFIGTSAGFSYNLLSTDGIYSLWGDQQESMEVSLEEARRAFDKGEVVFVDARYTWEFSEGHISDAVNVPLGAFEEGAQELVARLPKDTAIITYCMGTSCPSSMILARLLKEEFGFTQVRVLTAGWPGWKEAGYPVESP